MKREIKKGRFKFQETWVFPKEVTWFVKETMKRLHTTQKSYCHVFCGKSKIGGLRIDINKKLKPNLVADVLDLPKILGENSQENLLADEPWEIPYQKRRHYSYAMRDIVKPGGYLILNAPWDPWVKGLKLIEVWKVRQAYNSYRDLVDFWIFKKE